MAGASIEREIVIEAPPEVVWAVITRPEHVGGWFSDSAQIDLRPGGEVVLAWNEHGTSHARVETVEPPTRFSFRWIRGADTDVRPGNSTLVEFRLRPEGEGTRLQLVETGFAELDGSEADREALLGEHRMGWEQKVVELADYARQEVGASAGR